MNVDDFLFDGKKTSSYHVPTELAPALVEGVTFPSGGETLYGFVIKPEPTATPLPYTLLYFHGNKHNIDAFWQDVLRLHATGATVMIFDYRGYGLSGGDAATDEDLFGDADAALAFLGGRGLTPAQVVLYGYSLGNIGSLHLAASGAPYRAIVAQSAFASLDSLIQGGTFLPLPDGWINKSQFDNIAAVEHAAAPILVLHGADDETARFADNGRPLFAHAPDPKRLVVVPGAGHTDLPETMGAGPYEALIASWIAKPDAP
jgi:uncharacterized protein